LYLSALFEQQRSKKLSELCVYAWLWVFVLVYMKTEATGSGYVCLYLSDLFEQQLSKK